ncbi:MAG: VWA domain-containing protein [Myxococcota bacterium]|nr:VWA domain-containing protein [Myxococcota bacterium]
MGREWTRGVPALAGLLVLVLSAAGAGAEGRVWLGVVAPRENAQLAKSVPFVEVSGWAGAQQGGRHDVLLALDVSHSTLAPSGSDIDGDGRVSRHGCLLPWSLGSPSHWSLLRRGCPEAGDTIRAAELAAARRLLDRLDAQRTRMGLVTFHGGAKLVAPLGTPHPELRKALQDVDLLARDTAPGTDFRFAIETALEAFARAPARSDWDGAIARSVVFLSDGTPTLPGFGERPAREALEAAGRAGREGVPIHAFALGPEARDHEGIYSAMAERTGGRLVRVDRSAEIVEWLPLVDLADVAEVSMANVTSGRNGRAIRTFPDGSFDGYVPLVRGSNRLRVTARGSQGQETHVERVVHFEPPARRGARGREEERWERERFARTLEERTAETRALREARARQRKRLEVRIHEEQSKRLQLQVDAPADPAH